MKKAIGSAMMVLLLLMTLIPAASANSWGLKGDLLEAVSGTHTWDEYSTLGVQAGDLAVMHARYHNALFYLNPSKKLHVYTTAVYQPGDGRGTPGLSVDGDEVRILYGDGESYVFCDPEGNGEYQLASARIGSFSVEGRAGETGYGWTCRATDGSGNAVWPVRMLLSNFNIALFPHSVEEVRAMNRIRAVLEDHLQCLGHEYGTGETYSPDRPGRLLETGRKGTAAVYSAPYGPSAWQAAKGKAAVGQAGEIWQLSGYKNEDGQSWACIRYDVSERTQRIGYVRCSDLGLEEITGWDAEDPLVGFAHVDAEASSDTFLTDDPDVSQYPQFRVPKGTQFSCMGLYNDYYAYVGAEVKDGCFADGGAIVWGFVPLRDLVLPEGERASEAEARLCGSWKFDAGGSMGPDTLVFSQDGTFASGDWERDADPREGAEYAAASGTWRVQRYHPSMNLYWNDPPYQLVLEYRDGRVSVKGLSFDGDGFGLTNAEGGGGYVPDGLDEETEEHG